MRQRFSLSALFTIICSTIFAADTSEKGFSYLPEFHGVVRTRWELETSGGSSSRFQVRNARLTVGGKLAPIIDYFVQTDFCDRGKMKILDAWGQLGITDGLKVRAGQFRMPFGVEPFRAPANYIFANRSFIGKQVCNVRAVGAKLEYRPAFAPLTIEAGIFNPTSISDHEKWCRTYAYATKAACRLGNITLTTGFQSLEPDSVRINLADACISWANGGWTVEGEYMNKHYTNSAHKSCHAYCIYADYHMPVKAGVFNRLSFQGRFDGMTDHSDGTRGTDRRLTTDDPARNRFTVGSTLTYSYRAVHADLRVNYEKYIYRHGVIPAAGAGDKITAELVVRF